MGFPGGLGEMFQKAQQMQQDMQRIQEEAGKKTVEATAGGGMVTVVANGKQEIVKVTLDKQVLEMNDKDMLEDLVTAGVNSALKAARDLMKNEMGQLTQGLGPMADMLKGLK